MFNLNLFEVQNTNVKCIFFNIVQTLKNEEKASSNCLQITNTKENKRKQQEKIFLYNMTFIKNV